MRKLSTFCSCLRTEPWQNTTVSICSQLLLDSTLLSIRGHRSFTYDVCHAGSRASLPAIAEEQKLKLRQLTAISIAENKKAISHKCTHTVKVGVHVCHSVKTPILQKQPGCRQLRFVT